MLIVELRGNPAVIRSPVCVIGALAPEKASVVMFDSRTVDGSRNFVVVTICPSAPQSNNDGLVVARVVVATRRVLSGGSGGGFHSGGDLPHPRRKS